MDFVKQGNYHLVVKGQVFTYTYSQFDIYVTVAVDCNTMIITPTFISDMTFSMFVGGS